MSAVSTASWLRRRPVSLLSLLSIADTRYRHRKPSLTDSTSFEEQPPCNFNLRPRRVARIGTVYRPVDAHSNGEEEHRVQECYQFNNKLHTFTLDSINLNCLVNDRGRNAILEGLSKEPQAPAFASNHHHHLWDTSACRPTELSWRASRLVVLSHSSLTIL